MAITTPIIWDNLGENYLRRLRQRCYSIAILGLAWLLLLGIMLIYFKVTDWQFWLIIALNSGLLISYLIYQLWQHLRRLVDSFVPISQATKHNQAPRLSELESALLQQIFRLKNQQTANQPVSTNLNSLPMQLLERVNFGLILWDSNLQIIYANTLAKQLLDINDRLKLKFDNAQPGFYDWIQQSQQYSIASSQQWLNLGLPSTDDQPKRWYNLLANFNKEDTIETIALITESNDFQQQQQDFDFIAYAAHELRGPITIIRGYLDILNTNPPSTAAANQVIIDRLIVAGNRLSSYITNILNVAKVDQQNFKLSLQPTSPAVVIDEIYDDLQLRAKTDQKQLVIEIEPKLPNVPLDRLSLSQAITNLIDNAIKYSKPDGQITLKVFRQQDQICFEVSDHGVGIPLANINNLFKRFYRSRRTQQQISGTGIGLFITKIIVDAHQGSIVVDSQLQKGSTFTISIPINPTIPKSPNNITNHGLVKK